MRVVIALGGNALLRRGQPMSEPTREMPESADELVRGACVTLDGEIVHELLKPLIKEEVSR